jgi:hypothetical protein
MKKIISAVVMLGAMAQVTIAMGPMGDLTHRHFYKDQEWIWQREQPQPKGESGQKIKSQIFSVHVWRLPLASKPPFRPPLASTPPFHPPLASTPPFRPPSA